MAKSPSNRSRNKTPAGGKKPKARTSPKQGTSPSPVKKSRGRSTGGKSDVSVNNKSVKSSPRARSGSSISSPSLSSKSKTPKSVVVASASASQTKTKTTTTTTTITTTTTVISTGGGDVLDDLIDKISIGGLVALMVLTIGMGICLYGETDNVSLHICALVLGMGRGGVPGCATVAAAFWVLLAPDGYVKEMLALMTVAESIPNMLVGFAYRASADWMFALKLNLFTTLGLSLGYVANKYLSDIFIRRFAGLILLAVMGQMTWEKYRKYKANQASNGKKPLTATQKQQQIEVDEKEKKETFLKSVWILLPLGVIGGLLSFVAGNMGPLLNVYLVLLALPKYQMVGTRAAIYIPIDTLKIASKYMSGHLLIPDILRDAQYVLQAVLVFVGARSGGDALAFSSGANTSSSSSDYGLYFGLRLGVMGLIGVLLAKVWLRLASPEFFMFIYERVTYVMTGVMGILLCIGMSIGDLIKLFSIHLPKDSFSNLSPYDLLEPILEYLVGVDGFFFGSGFGVASSGAASVGVGSGGSSMGAKKAKRGVDMGDL